MGCKGKFDIRWARREDAASIARLFLISSDGLATYIWSRHAHPGQSIEAAGAERYAREGEAFSYQNCLVATEGTDVCGMAHAFEMQANPASESDGDPVLAPYAALEDPGSLYIAGLAVHAPQRGNGIGAALLDCVEARALIRGIARVSLICFEQNSVACEFYIRRGFRVVDRRPLVPHPTLHYPEGDALLMARTVESRIS